MRGQETQNLVVVESNSPLCKSLLRCLFIIQLSHLICFSEKGFFHDKSRLSIKVMIASFVFDNGFRFMFVH